MFKRSLVLGVLLSLFLTTPALASFRIEVSLTDRELVVYENDEISKRYEVAVGKYDKPTPTGDFTIRKVIWNPSWRPPDQPWAKGKTAKAPGDPENPMGRARLVYRMPNTIHGTTDIDSLGTATSHGSIRVANSIALEMAQLLLKAGGAWEGDQWFAQMVQNRTKEFQIPLERKIPVEVVD